MLGTSGALLLFSELKGDSKEERSDGRSLGRPWSKNLSKRHRRKRRRRRRRRCLFPPHISPDNVHRDFPLLCFTF